MSGTGRPGYEERAYWHATTPALPSYAGAPLPARVDVAVVGGGYTGVSAALHVARGGASVAVLEAETLGWGASTRNGGMVHPGLKWGPRTLRARYGAELGDRLYRATVDAFDLVETLVRDEAIDCDYVRSGHLSLAWTPAHAAWHEAQLAEIAPFGMSGRAVPRERLPEEIGTDHYYGGLVIDQSGGLHPGRYFAGLATAAARAGATLCERAGVRAVEREPGGFRLRTDRGELRCGEVILGTNGYTGGAVPWLQRRVIPIGSYIIATEPLDPAVAAEVSPKGRIFFDSKNFLYYWRVLPDRRMMFGGRASFRHTTIARTAAILSRAMAEVHPRLAGVRVDYAWGGNVAFTFDRMPHLGRREGITYALGYCGSGVALATGFGRTAAEVVLRGIDAVRPPFAEIPYPGAPVSERFYGGDPWFLPLVGEWFRLRDRWGRARARAFAG